ncbi:hypothetical protein B0J15DRAFT_191163 [Fusarium solani]|uniref:Transmembrane protein n=1 Tax=Fusarium solani TaxID=169388 RepID=A0A9P9L2T1_FUSSL|nr:uncharacterized protein B0J15DRAFT_191163 [Fusarium solani]KAH7272900.1 hypothetical protein B0J15DRAFT_191163 [Fusarium solani]
MDPLRYSHFVPFKHPVPCLGLGSSVHGFSRQGLGGGRGGGALSKRQGPRGSPSPSPVQQKQLFFCFALFFWWLSHLFLSDLGWTRANDGGALFVLLCAFGSVSRLRIWIDKLTPATKLSDGG